jgi:hypothetical protein
METKIKPTNKSTKFPKLKMKINSETNGSLSPKKLKNMNDSRNSLSPESKILKTLMKIDDNKKSFDRDYSIQRKGVPKNVNQYRHIIDTMHRDSDVEWIIELRSHRNIPSINKHTLPYPPKFYDQDFQDYKQKTEKDLLEKSKNPFTFKRNLGEYEHLIRKIGIPANSIQFGFDSTLRTLMSKEKYKFFNDNPWKPLNMSPKKDLLNTVFAPNTKLGMENVKKLSDYLIKPFESISEVSRLYF